MTHAEAQRYRKSVVITSPTVARSLTVTLTPEQFRMLDIAAKNMDITRALLAKQFIIEGLGVVPDKKLD